MWMGGGGFKIATLCADRLNGGLELATSEVAHPWTTKFLLTMTAPIVKTPVLKERNAPVVSLTARPFSSLPTSDQTVEAPSMDWDIFTVPAKQKDVVDRLLSSEFRAQRSAMKILIVEDNVINVKVIKQCLLKRGFSSLIVAVNGQLAVDESLKDKFDLILMDLEMPVKDGVRASAEITADVNNPNHKTPIVALTANATSVAQQRCADAGMSLYLTKPLVASDLMFSIAGLKPFAFYPLQYCPHVLLYRQG